MKQLDFNFRLLLLSKTISKLGGEILGFALLLFIVDFTQSSALLGVMAMLSAIPALVFTPIGGLIADRFHKKISLVVFAGVKALCNVVLMILLISGTYTIWNIALFRVISTTISMLNESFFTATIPRIVKEECLFEANGVIGSISSLGVVIGAIMGGILYGEIGIAPIAFFATVTFLISSICNLFLKIPHEKREIEGSLLRSVQNDFGESIQFLKYEKPLLLKMTLVFSVISLLFLPIFKIGLPFIVMIVFSQSVTLSFSVAILGMVLGGILAGSLKKYLAFHYLNRWLFALGTTGLSLALAFTPLMVNRPSAFWLFNASLFFILFLISLLNNSFNTFIQKEVPTHIFGKVDGVLDTAFNCVQPIGILLVGFFIETIDLSVIFLMITGCTWLFAAIGSKIMKQYAKKNQVNLT